MPSPRPNGQPPIPGGLWKTDGLDIIERFRIRLAAKRVKKERMERLLENQDFQYWMSEEVSPFVEMLKNQIMSGTTKGYQHDLLKGVLNVVSVMESANIQRVIAVLEKEMKNLNNAIRSGGSNAIDA